MRIACVLALAAGSCAAADESLFAFNDYLFPTLYRLDPATGAVQEAHAVTGHEALFGGLAEDGMLYTIDGYNDANHDRLFRIDPATGGGAVVGPTGENWNFRCISRNPATGEMWASRDNAIYKVNTATGAFSHIAPVTGPTLDQLTAMAINAQGEAYGTDIGNTGLFRIDLATGQATHLGDVGGSGNWFDDLAFDSAGVLHGSRLNGGLYTIDTATAAQTFRFGGIFRGLVFSGGAPCYADCEQDGDLDIFDFLCFQGEYANQSSYADCENDGDWDIFDFLCFQGFYANGCS